MWGCEAPGSSLRRSCASFVGGAKVHSNQTTSSSKLSPHISSPHNLTSMAADLQAIAQLLQASLDPSQNKQGERTFAHSNHSSSYQTVSKLCDDEVLKLTLFNTAEKALQEAEKQPKFSLALLHIVASDSFPPTTKLASALCFKNFIRRNWTVRSPSHLAIYTADD